MENRFLFETRPIALKQNMVIGNNYRFTVLTNRLIRLEFDPSGKFEDRASQSVFYRDFPENDFSHELNGDVLTIKTDCLMLTYDISKNCFEDNLKIKLLVEPASEWLFGDYFEDLGGTRKTLDTVNGALPLGRGVCSRNGFSVLDDTDSMILEDDGWVNLRNPDTKDVYFFGYSFDYLDAVKDYYRLTGAPPMLPAYALGNWWSRYHPYSGEEYLELMDKFRAEDVPFSVGVVDMDWHIVKLPEELSKAYGEFNSCMTTGWTGYTWNEELFPDYKQFLKELKNRNVVTSLNLHPAHGIRKHEVMFPEMAKAMGKDPEKTLVIPFDILDKKYMENYFNIVHHPYEEDGIGFWWIDFQQGNTYYWKYSENSTEERDPREKLDPLWMLNHLHTIDIARDGKRPMIFSRFCGYGSHRYPVGFSGDTIITWETLAFLPYFTATASNVGYSWWSHDIGGHFSGYRDDELIVRWMQWGVFSPINRLHSCDYEFLHKEPWFFNSRISGVIKENLRLRHKLFPYIYTMNYRNHKDLIPLIQPMYYTHPKNNSAYESPNQYWFGSEVMVAPIVEKNSTVTDLGRAVCWFPQGVWFDMFDGTKYTSKDKGGRKIEVFRPLEKYPVFAKSGAIIPTAIYETAENRLINSEKMEVLVFPGDNNTFTLYEDEGDYNNFQNGKFATTKMELKWSNSPEFIIAPAFDDTSVIPKIRNWKLTFRGFDTKVSFEVFVNGDEVEFTSEINEKTHSVSVFVTANTFDLLTVKITGENLIHSNLDIEEKWIDILQNAKVGYERKNDIAKHLRENINIHKKLALIVGQSPEEHHLDMAIKELLTLECDEYDCFEYGWADP